MHYLSEKIKIRFILLSALTLCWLITISVAFSQNTNFRFQHLSMEQGLSQETVQAIMQDSQGFMWFGTQEGLNKYDGYNFKTFAHDSQNRRSITSDWIWDLTEDSDGYIWVGTGGGGLSRFDREQNTFLNFKHDPNHNSLSNNNVRALYTDSRGILWIGTDGGLDSFNLKTQIFSHYPNIASKQAASTKIKIRSIVEDLQGFIWIGSDGDGIARLDPDTGKVKHFNDSVDTANRLVSNRILSLFVDVQDRLWVGSYDKGISLFNKSRDQISNYQHEPESINSLNSHLIRAFHQDNSGTIWIATDNGLDQFHEEKQGFSHYQHDPLNTYSLSSSKVTTLYQDNGGVFWVGTYKGLNKWNTATAAFAHYRTLPDKKYSLTNNGINAFAQASNGNIWVGSYNGLNLVDRKSGEITHFNTSELETNSLSEPRVMSLYVDQQDITWVGTRSSGLDRYDAKTGKFTNFKHQADNLNSLSANGITAIKAATNDKLWLGTFGGGLDLFSPKDNSFTHYRHDKKNKSSLSSDRIISVFEDSSGLLLIGTWGGGVNIFDPVTGKAKAFVHNPEDLESISSNNVLVTHEDSKGNLWFGTQGGGLNLLTAKNRSSKNSKFKRFNRQSGLPSNVVYSILEDNDGFLWLSTNRGLSKFDPVTGSVLNYDSSHGLQGNEFNIGAFFKSDDGMMFFGGTNGVTAFDPADIKPNQHLPPVVLTNFMKLNQKESKNINMNGLDSIKISYQDYLVAFEFAGLDYASPKKNQYSYKLEGFDENWIQAKNMRRATYTNLPSGHYVFKINASNNDGIWNEQGVNLDVIVTPAPWRTWWAYTIYSLILALIAVFIIKAYLNKLKKAALYRIELEQEVSKRTNELQQANVQLHNASVTDQLTGLHNRRYLESFVESKVAQLDRKYDQRNITTDKSDKPLSKMFMLIFDLDKFKPVNDTYGHSAGDKIIISIGDLLRETCRKEDVLVRWGGDEFLVVGEVEQISELLQLAERLLLKVKNTAFDIGLPQRIHLTCSIGFSFYPFSTDYPKLVSWEQVQMIADKGLYHSKSLGRNSWTGLVSGDQQLPISFMAMLAQDLNNVVELNYVNLVSSNQIKEISSAEKFEQFAKDKEILS